MFSNVTRPVPVSFLNAILALTLPAVFASSILCQESINETNTNSDSYARLKSDVETLASDAMEGRGVGTTGLDAAAEMIATRWKELDLETNLFDGSPFQEFTLDGPIVLGDRERNRLSFQGPNDARIDLELQTQFTPVSLGSSGAWNAPIVFAGYGITAKEESSSLDYDDYRGIDVSGKVVLVLRKEPRQHDERSPFSGSDPSQHAFFSAKLANAMEHKAAAMIIVNDRASGEADDDSLPIIEGAGRSFSRQPIPVMWAQRAIVDKLLGQSLGKSLSDLESEIDSDLLPRSAEIADWKAVGEAEIQPSKIKLKNVIATLPGQGDLAKEFVVIGAHYDHVGFGGPGSLAPGTVAIHNGADDNASGTACLLEVSRCLKNSLSGDHRTIIFIAFSAEERGLIGSRYYVRHPRFALEDTVAMLNLDMVGRLSGDLLTTFGVGTAKQFDAMLEELNQSKGLEYDKIAFGYGPSDHQSFFEMKIPVLHFFTGLHSDYHRPSDDSDKINIEGMVMISELVCKLAGEIATVPQRPTFVEVKGRAVPKRQPPGRLGIETDFNPTAEAGAFVRNVESGKAASNAGIQTGDVITRLNSKLVQTPRNLSEFLANYLPGDVIELEVLRNGQTEKIEVKLQR